MSVIIVLSTQENRANIKVDQDGSTKIVLYQSRNSCAGARSFKAVLATNIIKKIFRLKVEKSSWFVNNYVIFKQSPPIWRFPRNANKRGINIYLLASKYKCSWGEDSIFIVNFQQYILRTRANKNPEKTFIMFSFHCVSFGEKKKDEIYS